MKNLTVAEKNRIQRDFRNRCGRYIRECLSAGVLPAEVEDGLGRDLTAQDMLFLKTLVNDLATMVDLGGL